MNAQFGSAFSAGRSHVQSPAQQPQHARPLNAAAQLQAGPRPTAAPQHAVPQPTAQVKADLDLSDAALVRRDVPRGSLINIVA